MNRFHAASNSGKVTAPEVMKIPGWKRALDIALVLLASPLLLPLMGFIALLIRIVSPGPVFFRQERVGYLGRRFLCLKFRTMAVGADPDMHEGHLQNLLKSNTPMVKMDAQGDPRVIPFGRILRSSGLDELPQVINVLLGDMSLVGPRPCLPFEYEKYLPWQRERFSALPGLTGLWQVSGKNRTTFVEMILLDITYARSQTVWLDLKIICKTIPALIVQMWDDWAAKKSLADAARTKTDISVGTTKHYSVGREIVGYPRRSFQQRYSTRIESQQ